MDRYGEERVHCIRSGILARTTSTSTLPSTRMRRMAYRLLAIDLDGTLLTRHKRVSPRTRAALDAAAARSCHVVIATGRSFAVARYFCDGLTLSAPQITYNGAVVYDP